MTTPEPWPQAPGPQPAPPGPSVAGIIGAVITAIVAAVLILSWLASRAPETVQVVTCTTPLYGASCSESTPIPVSTQP